jgi:hypothetical protein
MRTLIVGALAATLVGCSCGVSTQSGLEACTGPDARAFACYDRNVAPSRLSQATEPEPSSIDKGTAGPKEKTALAARTAKPSSAHAGKTTRQASQATKSAVGADAKAEPAPSMAVAPPPDAIDPVIDKAKIAVAVKLENPSSAAFSEMNRSMRKNTLGQSVDTICGHVKGKKASGEDIGDRPFLYLVKDDEAYVADGTPTSPASTAYRNICK